MDAEQDAPRQPKRRGRPAGSKNKTTPHTPGAQTDALSQEVVFDDEQLAYTLAEEKLSPFSSLLRHVLRRNREEISHIAREMQVTEMMVYRWMNGSSDPRSSDLKRLPEVLAEHRGNLTYAINQTFPGVLNGPSSGVREIRKDIYRRVLDLVMTTVEDDARYWQVTQALFEYALLHLDSDRRGLAITYANLMPAHEDGVHSLREAAMRGNYPWPFSLESRAYLGSTTLAGTAAILQRVQTWDNLGNEERLVVDIDEFERSAAACPVMRAGRIAGVLIISSTQPGFFTDPMANQAVVEYAQLMALALREDDFYPCSILNLRPMPTLRWQREEIARSYVNRIIVYARKHMLSRQDAERRILVEMEQEFEDLGRFLKEQQTMTVEQAENTLL